MIEFDQLAVPATERKNPGRVNCIIPTPNGRVANLCFGGVNFDTLFATCGDRVYKRKLKVRGCQAFQEPHKLPKPRL